MTDYFWGEVMAGNYLDNRAKTTGASIDYWLTSIAGETRKGFMDHLRKHGSPGDVLVAELWLSAHDEQ